MQTLKVGLKTSEHEKNYPILILKERKLYNIACLYLILTTTVCNSNRLEINELSINRGLIQRNYGATEPQKEKAAHTARVVDALQDARRARVPPRVQNRGKRSTHRTWADGRFCSYTLSLEATQLTTLVTSALTFHRKAFHCLSFCFFWILNHFETWLFQTYVNYILKLWKILKKQLKWVTLDKSVNFSQFLYNMGMIDLTFKIQLKDNSDYHLWQYNRLQFYS